MAYQCKREPLSDDEVDRLSSTCEILRGTLLVWTLLDTGLRVSELANLRKDNVRWQERRLVICGERGPYGKRCKRRIIS